MALGNFDGVHRGHQVVIASAEEWAAAQGCASGVISFHPHPRLYFAPDTPFFRITPLPLKLRLLERLGLDAAFILEFGQALASLTPEEFFERVLVDRLGVAHVSAGWDYRFGAKRAGDADLLRTLGARHGAAVTIVEPQGDGEAPVSSSRIRAVLAEGRPEEAAALLGYTWRIVETVVGGEKRGRGLGFPTINMRLQEGTALAHGIYAVRVHVDGNAVPGAGYYGTRPTFEGDEPFLETTLLDFEGDLYGRELEVEIVSFLRPDKAFDGPEALAEQMREDCERARRRLVEIGSDSGPLNTPVRPESVA